MSSVPKAKKLLDTDELIIRLFNQGASWSDIAIATGRTWNSARWRGYQLGLRRAVSVGANCKSSRQNTIYNKRWPEKRAAHKAVERALLCGRLIKEPCRECGSVKSEAHHSNYSRPLDVIWLCRQCHTEEHRKLNALPAGASASAGLFGGE